MLLDRIVKENKYLTSLNIKKIEVHKDMRDILIEEMEIDIMLGGKPWKHNYYSVRINDKIKIPEAIFFYLYGDNEIIIHILTWRKLIPNQLKER